MNPLIPILSVAAGSGASVIDKLNFKKNKSSPAEIMAIVFLVMALASGLYLLTKGTPWQDVTYKAAGIAASIAVVSFLGNLFDFRSLKQTSLSIREPLADLQPIIAAFIGYLLFPSERKVIYIPVLLLAIGLVVFGFRKLDLHGKNLKGAHNMVLSVILYAMLPSIYKIAMNYYAIEQIMFIRTASIFALTVIIFKPVFKKNCSKKFSYGAASGLLTFLSAIAMLITIKELGAIGGSLVMMLGVGTRYIAGHFVFKDKVHYAELVMSSMLIILVVFTQFV